MVDPPEQEGQPYSSPVLEVTAHASANSLAYITNPDWPEEYRTLYVSLFGSVFSAEPVQPAVERILLTPIHGPDGVTFRGEASLFLDNLSRPLPLATDSNGDLLVGDYGSGIIYRVRYVGAP
jgi:glucose/arabinose dehydrogenase